jgi:hypothetical protein
MATLAELERAFRLYFEEVELCIRRRCWWALIHVLVVLPDVCAALESDDGRAKASLYRDWCKRFLDDSVLSPDDRYDLRCRVLHQGTTRTSGKYNSYSFVYSEYLPTGGKHTVDLVAPGDVALDVEKLAAETILGIKRWFEDLQSTDHSRERERVEQNLPALVTLRVQEAGLPVVGGVEVAFITSSGNWRGLGSDWSDSNPTWRHHSPYSD